MLLKSSEEEGRPGVEHPAHSALTEADTHTIRVDVMRTRGNHPAFGPQMRERLRELLTQLCLKEKIRYMQGLHEVAAVFAYIESTEGFHPTESTESTDASSRTLECFMAFVRNFMPCFYDAESFVILHITLLFFRQLLLYHLPHLHNQLEEAGVAPVVYATPWFITLFAYKNPLHVTMRLWHEYIRRGDPTFVPFLAVALMELEKQAFLNVEEDDLNSAVDRTRITSLEKLRDVWKAAESLHARTPKSFTFRMSKVLTQVRQQLRKLSDMQSDMQWMSLGKETGHPWTESVLARAEQERRLALLAREAIAQYVRPVPSKVSEAGTAVPSSGLPSLRVLLLDVRPRSAFDAEHLPHAVHFHPPCLARLAQATNGSRRSAERLAQALKQAMVEVGDLVLRKDSTPTMAAEDDGLGAEVFQSLQLAASEAWGEGWLSESERAHLAILGGEEDWDSAQLCRPGAVAALFELLAEQLSMPRVSVVLGGAAVLHREAEKRGVPTTATPPTPAAAAAESAAAGAERLRGFLSKTATGARSAFQSFPSFKRDGKAKDAKDAKGSES
ncbi:unnamed protein product [Durusdinium trenchii]|uniref:TBC1 domain family member 23 n=1 Tax=Durusdinium trenchii TaxID=1381693 RepID=A0ABP0QJF8_9DINO